MTISQLFRAEGGSGPNDDCLVGDPLPPEEQGHKERDNQSPNHNERIGSAVKDSIAQCHGGHNDPDCPPPSKGERNLSRASRITGSEYLPGAEIGKQPGGG